MKTLFVRTTVAVLAAGLISSSAFAATAKTKTKAKAAPATISCPACHMPMPVKKSAAYPVPEKINGKTYYCCNKCPIGKKTLAAMKHAKKPAMKPASTMKPKAK